MKILITGSNGLLGQKLVTLLQSLPQIETIATARGANRLKGDFKRFTYHPLDVTDGKAVEALVAESQPDAIIHTAAMTQVDDCEHDHEGCLRLNVEATRFITAAAAAQNAHLVHVSTDFIFDGTAGPYDEDAEPNPISFYGQSKWEAEKIVMASPGSWAIARTILVYGIAQDMSRSNIVLWVKNSLEQGKKIRVVNDQWRTPTLAEDLAMGCYLLADKKAEGVFNIGGPDLRTPYEMALATARYFNLDESLIEETDGSQFTQPAPRPPRTGLIIEKAERLLGYRPHTFAEGIHVLAGQLK